MGIFSIHFQLFSGKQLHQTIELCKFNSIFGSFQDFCVNLLVLYCKIILIIHHDFSVRFLFQSHFTVLQNHFLFIMIFFKIFRILLQVPEFKRKILLHFEFYSFLYLAIAFCGPEVELWHMPSFFNTLCHYLSDTGGEYLSGFDRISDSHFFQFLRKLWKVSCLPAWKQQKFPYSLMRMGNSREFLFEGQFTGLPLSVGLDRGPFQGTRCAPMIKTTSKHDSTS